MCVVHSNQPLKESGMLHYLRIITPDTDMRILLKEKSEVDSILTDVIRKAKALGHVVHEFLSDNGGEFDNEKVRNVLNKNGIVHRLTAPYTPEQNGNTERENRTVNEMARTLMYANKETEFPEEIWGKYGSVYFK